MAIRLPRLPVNWKEQPQLFERYWDETLQEIERTLNAILSIPLIEQAVEDAQAAADAAMNAAEVAQNAADSQSSEASLVNSYTTGFAGSLVSCNSSGAVTIQAHTRVYGDGTSVSVSGGVLASGAAAGDTVRVFYSDPSKTGGSVSYYFTIDPAAFPAQTGGVHSVGAVIVPAVGSQGGNTVRPPGYVEP